MRKTQKKHRKLLQSDENCIIIEMHTNNVKRINIKLLSATPSDQSDLFVFNNGQAYGENIKNIFSCKEKKGVVKERENDMKGNNMNTRVSTKTTKAVDNDCASSDLNAALTVDAGECIEEINQKIPSTSPFYALDGKSAEDLIVQFELDKYVPVNLDKLLQYYNIFLRVTDFKTFEQEPEIAQKIGKRGSVLGAVKEQNNHIYIYFKDGDSIHRQRFTIAHELAHCCLNAKQLSRSGHIEYRLDLEKPAVGGDEYKANIFAGELLIPKTIIKAIYKSIPNPKVDVLAKLFDVSFNVMESRLKYLGYIK